MAKQIAEQRTLLFLKSKARSTAQKWVRLASKLDEVYQVVKQYATLTSHRRCVKQLKKVSHWHQCKTNLPIKWLNYATAHLPR